MTLKGADKISVIFLVFIYRQVAIAVGIHTS